LCVKLSRGHASVRFTQERKGTACKAGGLFRRFMGARPAFPPPAARRFLVGAVRAYGPACPRTAGAQARNRVVFCCSIGLHLPILSASPCHSLYISLRSFTLFSESDCCYCALSQAGGTPQFALRRSEKEPDVKSAAYSATSWARVPPSHRRRHAGF
jgi:hypothetical protein